MSTIGRQRKWKWRLFSVLKNRLTNHDGRPIGSSLGPVGEWSCYAKVAVEADDEQIENARIARQIIQGEPRIADVRSQGPISKQDGYRVKRHRDKSYSEVRYR